MSKADQAQPDREQPNRVDEPQDPRQSGQGEKQEVRKPIAGRQQIVNKKAIQHQRNDMVVDSLSLQVELEDGARYEGNQAEARPQNGEPTQRSGDRIRAYTCLLANPQQIDRERQRHDGRADPYETKGYKSLPVNDGQSAQHRSAFRPR